MSYNLLYMLQTGKDFNLKLNKFTPFIEISQELSQVPDWKLANLVISKASLLSNDSSKSTSSDYEDYEQSLKFQKLI